MPTTDPRLGLITPIGSDNVVELRTAIANHAAILDGSVLYSEGTFAARPAAGTAGRVYGGTDTGLYYWDSGSAWLTLGLSVSKVVALGIDITAGQFVVINAPGAATVNLPAPTANAVCGVCTLTGFQTMVSAGSAIIYHSGTAGVAVTSFETGIYGSTVILRSDGTNWYVQGEAAGFSSYAPGGSFTARLGCCNFGAPSTTITLPPATTVGTVPIVAGVSVTAVTPVTVAYSGGAIYGPGMAGVSSFVLGAASAFVILQSDGSNWRVIAGGPTGWSPMTLAGGIVAQGYAPSARMLPPGDTVQLKGGLFNSTGSPIGGTLATIPAGLRPAIDLAFLVDLGGSSNTINITSAGAIALGGSLPATTYMLLDGLTFTTS